MILFPKTIVLATTGNCRFRIFVAAVLLLLATVTRADVKFAVTLHQNTAGQLTLTATGTPDPGWHVTMKSFVLEGAKNAELGGDINAADSCTFTQQVTTTGTKDFLLKGYFSYTACNDEQCLAPKTVEFAFDSNDAAGIAESTDNAAEAGITDTPSADPLPSGLWQLFILGLAGGLLALLTPCVWPIIPMTVSFFLKNGGKRGAFLYGGCIVTIFLALGIAVTALMGANAMNRLATDAVFNLVCFAVLLIFGLALTGTFQMQLPQSWASSLDSRADRAGGLLGIFFMALTLVVVSFSCTAPIVGAMLVGVVSEGNILGPTVGMMGFALALALPFTVFALFPQWLKRLPKSGNWMTRIKVILGTLEIAFSLKFLSVADMAYGWGILPRWLFFCIWAALAGGIAVYLAWSLRRSGIVRGAICTALPAAFAVYLIRGAFGYPCTLVAAFAPPQELADPSHMTDRDFTNLEQIVTAARRSGKPVFVDFTGYGCVNCRKMEAAVFTDPRVKKILTEKFFYIALHVDDRTPLPQQETVEINGTTRKLRTIGDRWAAVEEQRFGSVSQPMYVIIGTDGLQHGKPRYYDEDVEAFIQWLNGGAGDDGCQ